MRTAHGASARNLDQPAWAMALMRAAPESSEPPRASRAATTARVARVLEARGIERVGRRGAEVDEEARGLAIVVDERDLGEMKEDRRTGERREEASRAREALGAARETPRVRTDQLERGV